MKRIAAAVVGRRRCRAAPAATAAAAALLACAGCFFLFLSSEGGGGTKDVQSASLPKGALRVTSSTQLAAERMLGSSADGDHVAAAAADGVGSLPFRHIYLCGIPRSAVKMLFPEYEGRDEHLTSLLGMRDGTHVDIEPTEHDLLLSMHSLDQARCAKPLGRKVRGHILLFPGTMMFFNAEAADTQGGPRPLGGGTGPPVRTPRDACSPGYVNCEDLQGTNASRAVQYERAGERFNFLPPSDRAYFFGPHKDSERSVRLPLLTQQLLFRRFGDDTFGVIRYPDRKPSNTGEHFAVFLASHCVPFRDEAAKKIAQLGEVHVGERWMSRCADTVPDPTEGLPPRILLEPGGTSERDWSSNGKLMTRYKFALVMENTYRDGYVTEKLLNAYRSGAVPIWYGGRWALNMFNPEAMVFYDVEDPGPALERIAFLRDHPNEYEKVLRAPILKDGERTVEEYFSLDDSIGGGKLKKRIRRLVGIDGGEGEEGKIGVKSA